MVVLSVIWLVAEFVTVTNRETIVRSLQWDAALSTTKAAVFSGIAGWMRAGDHLQ